MNSSDIKTIKNCLIFFTVIWVALLLWAFGSWAWSRYKAAQAEAEDKKVQPTRVAAAQSAVK